MEWLAPIALALVVSVIAPYIASRQTAKLAQEKLDNEREYQAKQLAAQAEAARVLKETTEAQVAATEEAARLFKANTEGIMTQLTRDKAKLARIEFNGDGQLTAAIRAQLAAEQAKLVVMEKDPDNSPVAVAALLATRATITSLEETIRVRDELAAKAASAPPEGDPLPVTVVNTLAEPVPTVTAPDAGDGAGVP